MSRDTREERKNKLLGRTVFEMASMVEHVLAKDPRQRYVRNAVINAAHALTRAFVTALATLENNVEQDQNAFLLNRYLAEKLPKYLSDLSDIYRAKMEGTND